MVGELLMASKQITCARPSCTVTVAKRKPWHKYCSDTCRSIDWRAKRLAQSMTDTVMRGVDDESHT